MASVVGSSGVLAEGSNIHYSPVDKKPLCSYSNKLCRQRRLNGYGFCIRHILEDKSAPFKQCHFVTRNNSQKCLNAIPRNQARGYCHSHMQVAGILPKTVKKVKEPKSTAQPPPNRQTTVSKPSKELMTPDSTSGINEPIPTASKSKHKIQDFSPNEFTGHRVPKKRKPKPSVPDLASNLNTIPKTDDNSRDKPFEQLKTLKILEKLSSQGRPHPGASLSTSVPTKVPGFDETVESWQEFLKRARLNYQSQYLELSQCRKVRREKQRFDVGLRESLLACARIDLRRCAQILTNGEDLESTIRTGQGVSLNVLKNDPHAVTPEPSEVRIKVKSKKEKKTVLKSSEPATLDKNKSKLTKGTSRKWQGQGPAEGLQDGSQSLPVKKRQKVANSQNGLRALTEPAPVISLTPENHHPASSGAVVPCQVVTMETVLHSVTSSDTPDGVITDTSFDSAFDHSPSHPDSDFGDVDELERSFVLHLDPEIAHQASRIMEENGLTEADFNDLFPESRLVDQKVGLVSDIDLTSSLDPTDIDYSLFNMFPHNFQRGHDASVSLRNNL